MGYSPTPTLANTESLHSLDWIQDSILERNRRLRNDREIATSLRGAHGEITQQWVWAQLLRLSSAGQSWFVVSLAGRSAMRAFAQHISQP